MSTIAEEPSGGEETTSNDGSDHSTAENLASCITLQVIPMAPVTKQFNCAALSNYALALSIMCLSIPYLGCICYSFHVLFGFFLSLSLSLSLLFPPSLSLSLTLSLFSPPLSPSSLFHCVQRVTGVSMRHKKAPPSTVLLEGWMVHYTNKLALVRTHCVLLIAICT